MIQPDGGLFTRGGEEPPEYWVDNLANLYQFIETLYADFEVDPPYGVDYLALLDVEEASGKILRSNVGIKTPSVFKRAAAFALGFMHTSPLHVKFPASGFHPGAARVAHIDNHQNAIVAFGYARQCLVKATYKCGETDVILENKITVSPHFYADLIFTLTTTPVGKQNPVPAVCFHEMALLFESLAYQDNTGCCYDRTI